MNTEGNTQKKGNSTLKFIFLALAFILSIFWVKGLIKDHKNTPTNPSPQKENVADTESKPSCPKTANSFPTSGEGIVTVNEPGNAYLSPFLSYFRILGEDSAKIVFASNPDIFLVCDTKPENEEQMKKWKEMPTGNYYIFPYGKKEKIRISWWQK